MHTAYLDLLTVKKFGTEYNVAFYTAMDTIYIRQMTVFYPFSTIGYQYHFYC